VPRLCGAGVRAARGASLRVVLGAGAGGAGFYWGGRFGWARRGGTGPRPPGGKFGGGGGLSRPWAAGGTAAVGTLGGSGGRALGGGAGGQGVGGGGGVLGVGGGGAACFALGVVFFGSFLHCSSTSCLRVPIMAFVDPPFPPPFYGSPVPQLSLTPFVEFGLFGSFVFFPVWVPDRCFCVSFGVHAIGFGPRSVWSCFWLSLLASFFFNLTASLYCVVR